MSCAFNREQFRPLRLVHPSEPRFLSEDSEAEVTSKASQRAREQWAAAQACIQRREQQDRALAYLALKQMDRDRVWWRRALRKIVNW